MDPEKLKQRAWRLRRDTDLAHVPVWDSLHKMADVVTALRQSPPPWYAEELSDWRAELIRTIRKGAGRPNPTSA